MAHQHRKVTDRQLVDAVVALRAAEGACTYEALAKAVGLSRNTTHTRVRALAKHGTLLVGQLAGSIRPARYHLALRLVIGDGAVTVDHIGDLHSHAPGGDEATEGGEAAG